MNKKLIWLGPCVMAFIFGVNAMNKVIFPGMYREDIKVSANKEVDECLLDGEDGVCDKTGYEIKNLEKGDYDVVIKVREYEKGALKSNKEQITVPVTVDEEGVIGGTIQMNDKVFGCSVEGSNVTMPLAMCKDIDKGLGSIGVIDKTLVLGKDTEIIAYSVGEDNTLVGVDMEEELYSSDNLHDVIVSINIKKK